MQEDIEKIENKVKEIEQKSFAMSILSDYKTAFKRLFYVLIIVLFMWFGTIGYLVYVLNDIGVVETTQEIEDIDSIENSNITNGDVYGEDNTNN